MNKILILIISFLFLSCKNDKEKRGFLPKGESYSKNHVLKEVKKDGIYKEYYDTGTLRLRTKYLKGIISDSIFQYYRNGKLKEKGLVHKGLKTGWWNYYSVKGDLKSKNEYVIINDSLYKNQTISYYNNGKINYDLSSFFKIELADTLSLGKNAAKLYYHSNFNNVAEKFLYVIIENVYSKNKIVKDTFMNEDNYTRFGVFAEKEGLKKIKGIVLEKLLYIKKISNDSSELIFKSHKKYFERNVYVKK